MASGSSVAALLNYARQIVPVELQHLMGTRELIDLYRQVADGRGDQFDGSGNSGNAHGVGSGEGDAAGRMRDAKNAEREIGVGERVAFALKETLETVEGLQQPGQTQLLRYYVTAICQNKNRM